MSAGTLTHRSRLPRPELIHIRLSVIGWTTAGCGALVVFLAIGFLVPLFGSLHQLARLALINGPLVAAYLILCCVVITRHFGRHVSETLLWVREDRPPDEREHRARLGMAWSLGTGVPLLGLLVVGVAGLARPHVQVGDVAAAVLFLSVVAWVAGFCVILLAAKAISDPLLALRRGLDEVERGELDAHVEVDDGSEVGLLQAGFNHMAEGLRERERIRDLFGRQVGEDVARLALSQGVQLGGEEREIAAVFIDMAGFTPLALAVAPSEVVRLLNRFFRVIIEVVECEHGMVKKFEGDAALCVFGAPVSREHPTVDALRAARTLAERLPAELPEVDFGIGISAGLAVAGHVGAEHRFEYTVIGDPVNEAARLAELAKQRPGRVLASDAALDRAPRHESDSWSRTEAAVLRGRSVATGLGQPGPAAG